MDQVPLGSMLRSPLQNVDVGRMKCFKRAACESIIIYYSSFASVGGKATGPA